MSVFPYIALQYCQVPVKVGEIVYDFSLTTKGENYIYGISFHTHPLLLERVGFTDHYRLSAADVDYMQILINGYPVSTIYNTYRDEPVCLQSQMSGVYSVEDIDFFNGNPIPTGCFKNDPVLRVVFWRPPVTPFWITFTLANSPWAICRHIYLKEKC